jgi:16S rRNA (adenine1518-N6/adenine1519-N6)-dimethyltransferase
MQTIKAKKKLSQNFLVNPKTQQKIVISWLNLFEEYSSNLDYFLEIGPGTGCLTQVLLENTNKKVLAVEIDLELIQLLKKNLSNYPNFNLISGDAANLKYQEMGNFLLVSNLPYQIGSRLLIDFSIARPDLPFSVILQKEVVSKLFFRENFTLFGAWLNIFYNTKIITDIAKENFKPIPKVTSSLLQAKPKESQLKNFLNTEEKRKEAFLKLKKIFINPRKNLANNLKNLGWEKAKIITFFDKMNFSKDFRYSTKNYAEVFLEILKFD